MLQVWASFALSLPLQILNSQFMKTKQQVTEEKGQAHQKATRHTSPQERTKTEKTRTRTPRQKVQEEFNDSSSSRQLQTKFQEHATNKHVLILSCRVFHMAMPSLRPFLAATSLDHLHTLVQQGYNNVQVTYKKRSRPSQKQGSENCRQVELQNHDN